jgi:hypothetical protein
MATRTRRRIDLGQQMYGEVLDGEWQPVRPRELVWGEVVALYTQAPTIAGLRLGDGRTVDVRRVDR